MRRTAVVALLVLLVQFLLPILLIHSEPLNVREPQQPEVQTVLPIHQVTQEQEITPEDERHTLSVLWDDGTVRMMCLADYLWGVVAAEMPASFEMEALKAQAVAARTYCMSEETTYRAGHPLAQVCTQSSCCQAFITREEAVLAWGEQADLYSRRIEQAVKQTDGLGVLYQGQPIQALYFSSAPGQTADAQNVWSRAVPYLVSVDSPEGEEVPEYHSQLTMSSSEVKRRILDQYPKAKLSGKPGEWFSGFKRSPSGMVISVQVGGLTLKGGEVRKLLDLRSACFTVSVTGNQMVFHTTGYGHGVGLSQYGANAMAREGKSFRDILTWYYTGVEVEPIWA